MNLAQFLIRAARTRPNSPAIYLGQHQLFTYAEWAHRSARIAAYLHSSMKLSPGERVAVYMSNVPEYLEILYGIWWAGLAAVPVNAKLHPRELRFILNDAGASVLFVSDDLASSLGSDCPAVSSLRQVVVVGYGSDYRELMKCHPMEPLGGADDELAWLFYTSGTTGEPKGAMQTHRNLTAMSLCYLADVDAVSEADTTVYAAPMSHGAGLYNFPFVLKAARHVVPESRGFDTDELIDLSQKMRGLCMFAAPTMVMRLADRVQSREADVSGFKTVVYGGGPMYVEDIKNAMAFMGERFVQIYGQGESPMTITVLPKSDLGARSHSEWTHRIASVGFAQSLVEVQVVGEDGRPLAHGETGEVVVRGDTVMKGYWNGPAATARAIRNGWLWTGDLGSLDSKGYLTLKDRSKDVIISGGSNIYPREVEEVLLAHPKVREVSVVGKADREWGEIVVAFVVGTGVTAGELDQLCLDRIARFKRPKEYRFVGELPKNNYGKTLKTALRKLL